MSISMPFRPLRWLITTAFLPIAFLKCHAQDTLNLQQCISYAWEHNITLRQADLNLQQQQGNYNKTKAGALPTLNAGGNQNYNFGRTIDPSTNQFASQQSRTNYFSLQSDIVLFDGLQRINSIRQAQWSKEAGVQSLEKAKQDVALTVANMYLQILLLEERESQVKNQLQGSTEQQKKSQILYNSGAITKAKSLEADAQLAADEANLVDIQNQLLKAVLNLKQYMNYDITKPLNVAKVNINAQDNKYTDDDLNSAIKDKADKLPAVQQAYFSRESALYGWKASKGNYYPRLVASASIHSIYSSLYRTAAYQLDGYQPIGYVAADSSIVVAPKYIPQLSKVSFQEQLKNNFGQSLGFQLNIPIFNGLQTTYAVQSAKISLSNAELTLDNAKAQARNDIYQAYEGMKMAEKKYNAATIKLGAQESLFKQTDIGYKAGTISYFDFNAQRTLYDNAEIDVLQAKYEYIFQTKIFEYYLGKPVQF